MKRDLSISLYQFVFSLSQSLDLINPEMSNQHKRVAYIALRIAEETGLTGRIKEDIVVAASLHDIGRLSNQRNPTAEESAEVRRRNARFGYQLLQKFIPFRFPARIVRFHNIPWNYGTNQVLEGVAVPIGSHIVHLATVVNGLLEATQPAYTQVSRIQAQISALADEVLAPDYVAAFLKLSKSVAFWLDLTTADYADLMIQRMPFTTLELSPSGLLDFAELLAQIIDFRSRFTATHSSGVASVAATLGQLIGFPQTDCTQLLIAGYLHDIGKLAIPTELLEKNEKLTEAEWGIMQSHPYYTYRILSPIKGLSEIAMWCGSHHEKLSGDGYPFCLHHLEISLEARILAVADVFTAVTEHRPYRKGMQVAQVHALLTKMAKARHLDDKVVQTLLTHYETINLARIAAQSNALDDYREFMQGLTILDLSAARAAHITWKDRLRDYLDGKLEIRRKDLFDHHQCELGQWYASEGLTLYGHIPEMQELDKPHSELHQLMHALVRLHDSGAKLEAEILFKQVDELSAQIIELLHAIERKAAVDLDIHHEFGMDPDRVLAAV